jgi:two-component system, sensor histidine kinase ChiS
MVYKSKNYLLAGLIFMLITFRLYGQADMVKFEHIGLQEGLSHGIVYNLFQDSKGFLWVSTQVGLNRYDGFNFKVYLHNPLDSNSISANSTGPIIEDSAGNLWIGTWGGGLNRYDRKTATFKAFRNDPDNPESISDNRIHALYLHSDGTLWIGTFAGGVNVLDLKHFTETGIAKFKSYQYNSSNPNTLNHNRVWAIIGDRRNQLWMATDEGVGVLNPVTGNFKRYQNDSKNPYSISNNKIYSIIEDRQGFIWVATLYGLNRWDPHTDRFMVFYNDIRQIHSVSDNRIRFLSEDRKGGIWIGTFEGGLNRYDPGTGTFKSYQNSRIDPHSLSNNFIRVVYLDQSDNLWIGCGTYGLDKLDLNKPFRHYQYEPGKDKLIAHNDVISITEDRLDESPVLWVGTYGGGLYRWDLDNENFILYLSDPANPYSISDNRIRALYQDSKGTLWIGTIDGINRLDKPYNRFIRYRQDKRDTKGLSNNRVSSIVEDAYGMLWIGTDGGGLNRFDRITGVFSVLTSMPTNSESISSNFINTILNDNHNDSILWIATENGLNCLNVITLKFKNFKHDPEDSNSVSGNTITGLFQDTAGILWIGTNGGGLNRLDPAESGRFKRYDSRHGLIHSVIYGILQDDKGFLWMGTSRGLSRFDPSQETFRNYDLSDGLILRGFDEKAFYPCKNRYGEFFFGGLNGITRFFPAEIVDNNHLPPVVLTGIKKFNQTISFTQDFSEILSIELTYRDNFISFEFAALDFANPSKNQYAFILEGFESGWSNTGTRNYVNYTNLSDGHYVFKVRGSNNDGLWNETGMAIPIFIAPPYWNTWWFRVLTILFFGCAVFVVYRWRIRQIEWQKRKLETQVAERTSELIHMNKQLKQLNEEKNEFLGIAAHDLRNPLGAIIGFIDLLVSDIRSDRLNPNEAIMDLEMVLKSARQMVHLITELLDISAIESGKITIEKLPNNLNAIIEDCERIHRRTAMQKKITLHIEKNEQLPSLFIDKSRIAEVIDNLLSNAIKYTYSGGTIKLYSELLPGEAVVHIKDTGQGLHEGDLKMIFKTFKKLSATPTGGETSTGFGLAIVKKIVELHGGHVWVESRKNEGSTFSFSLPLNSKK